MKMFGFTGLKTLHDDMKKKREERAIFPFEFKGKNFSCIFLTDIIPYRLYLTTLGIHSEVFELEIEKGYNAKCFIDGYKELIGYLEIKYDPAHKFVPYDFYKVLNERIPEKFAKRPNYKDILKNLDIPNKKLKEREYMYNEKGMILAKATNGIEGYVYEEEVRKDSSEERTINVYNKDGKVIGDFKIEFGEEE